MRYFSFLILIVYLVFASCAQIGGQDGIPIGGRGDVPYYEAVYRELIGPVKKVEREAFYVKEGANVNPDKLNPEEQLRFGSQEFLEYNKYGHQTTHSFYGQKNKLSWKCLNIYNDQGNLEKFIFYDKAEELERFRELSYDNKDNLIKEIIFKKDSSVFRTFDYIYNKLNQKIEEQNNQNFENKKTYEYDHKGRVKKEFIYNSDTISMWVKKTYHHGQKLASIQLFRPNGTPHRTEIFKYRNNVIYEKKIEYHHNNTVDIFEFNNIGCPIRIIFMKSDGHERKVDRYEYPKVDKAGNWLERHIYKNDKLYTVDYRTIEYY